MKNLLKIFVLMLGVVVFASLTATDSFGQSRDGEERGKRIELTKNAKKNGYKIRLGNGKIFVRLNDVINPFDGKPLEGLHKIFYQCTEDSDEFEIDEVKFWRGSTQNLTLESCIFTDGFESGDVSAWSYSGSGN